jgi:ribosomal protein L29
MKIKELKDRSKGELEKLVSEEREKLRALRFGLSVSQESKVRKLRASKKTIAQALTLIKQK